MKIFATVFAILAVGPALATDVTSGKRVFDRYCAECHAAGFGHPGTQQLGWTRGRAQSVLESRKNLTPLYIATIVRHGLAEMPPYRPTEIDDAALDSLIHYLTAQTTSPKPDQ